MFIKGHLRKERTHRLRLRRDAKPIASPDRISASAGQLAHWLTGNGSDAEDVVQDAPLHAFRAIRGYAGGGASR
jgi:hypothetical protein